ncbi:ATP-dependent DNA helicase [Paenibacillus sp. UMB7766-LJ446]|uniref:ATP-dependent DNA helicase n=1 Tax=Paenibacillus sp. UMB7766-LJ446 TaxID=3046313 RepID=UPI00254FEA1E|nr:ATP-dependent DNA helicase [Paenibacillus sp. UMB7766-LJ446]MDK8193118.1 ATP-dependent DNA helicase [Paenibacillus sp. UMB7766-LJ446]
MTKLSTDLHIELNEIRQTFITKLNDLYHEVRKEMKNEHGKPITFKLLYEKREVSNVVEALGTFIEKVKSLKLKGVSDILERMFECNDDLDFINENGRKSWAYWATIEKRGQLILHAAPLYPKAVLARGLFDKVPVVLASATMSTMTAQGKTFAFYAGRVGVKDFDSIVVDSPFDYENKTMLICPDDAPDANSPDYNSYLIEKLEEILMYTGGRMLVLFTSFETMNQTAQKLKPYCTDNDLNLLVQYPGCDRESIIHELKTNPSTVVLGCSSFWTGVDVPGDALTAVVIAKLPFPMPNEPLIQAQLAVIEQAQRSSFFDYMFPKMMVKLQQGFGRLNRSMQCQGAVIILDNRIFKKRYGKMVIKTLPKCKYSRNISDLIHILPC